MHYTATVRTHPPPHAAGTEYYELSDEDVVPARGSRPPFLGEPRGPQERDQRRTVLQIVDYPSLPVLDAPEPLMVGQVIEVPKIQRSSRWSYRRFVDSLRQPQTVEHLMEVPTIISCSSLQRAVEQNVDIPAVGGSGTGGGLSGFLPGQSYSMTAEQIVDNPVPREVLEIYKVFPVDRVQLRFRSRFLSFPIQVAAMQIFSRSRAPQRLPRILLDKLVKGFFALFPVSKKVRRSRALSSARVPRESSSWPS